MVNCWICMNIIKDSDYLLLPVNDDYIGEDISIFKGTFIIKTQEPYQFAYYNVCNLCMNQYLKIYNNKFKYLKNREIGKLF